MDCRFYSVKELAGILGCSTDLIYRRLSEKPKRFLVKGATKCGSWKFSKHVIDSCIENGEPIIQRVDIITDDNIQTVRQYVYSRTLRKGDSK